MENPERRNNPDQPEQTNICGCDHVQATELHITSLLLETKGKPAPHLLAIIEK